MTNDEQIQKQQNVSAKTGDLVEDELGIQWRVVQVLGNGQISRVRVGSLAEKFIFNLDETGSYGDNQDHRKVR